MILPPIYGAPADHATPPLSVYFRYMGHRIDSSRKHWADKTATDLEDDLSVLVSMLMKESLELGQLANRRKPFMRCFLITVDIERERFQIRQTAQIRQIVAADVPRPLRKPFMLCFPFPIIVDL